MTLEQLAAITGSACHTYAPDQPDDDQITERAHTIACRRTPLSCNYNDKIDALP